MEWFDTYEGRWSASDESIRLNGSVKAVSPRFRIDDTIRGTGLREYMNGVRYEDRPGVKYEFTEMVSGVLLTKDDVKELQRRKAKRGEM